MLKLVDGLCVGFNSYVGRVGEVLNNYLPKYKSFKMGFFTRVSGIDRTTDKALTAYNIKAVLYNAATVYMIMAIALVILGNPLALVDVAAGLGVRLFIERAMEKTTVGSFGNNHQASDNKPFSLLFKYIYV